MSLPPVFISFYVLFNIYPTLRQFLCSLSFHFLLLSHLAIPCLHLCTIHRVILYISVLFFIPSLPSLSYSPYFSSLFILSASSFLSNLVSPLPLSTIDILILYTSLLFFARSLPSLSYSPFPRASFFIMSSSLII